MTMHHIATQTVANTSTSFISFSNIPQTYTHLQIRIWSRSRNAATYDATYLTPYSTNTGADAAYHSLYGSGSFVGVNGYTAQSYAILGYIPALNAASNNWASTIIDITDYSSTSKNKTIRGIYGWDDNGVSSGSPLAGFNSAVSISLGTTAISGLRFLINTAFESGTRIDLYGLTINPLATGE